VERIIVGLDPALISQLRAFMADAQGWDVDRCVTFALLHWLQRQEYRGKDEMELINLMANAAVEAMQCQNL
jgi:hypothetical protein